MPSTEERLDALEASILSLASNKLDITDFNTIVNNINTELADFRSTLASLLSNLDAMRQYLVNQI